MNLGLVLWTRQDRERFYVSSVYLVIYTELCQSTEYRIWTQISRVHSPVVRAADCRSAGPWFNSGWRTLFTFVTWYDKLTNDDFLMINIMSPITTSISTITRKSVNKEKRREEKRREEKRREEKRREEKRREEKRREEKRKKKRKKKRKEKKRKEKKRKEKKTQEKTRREKKEKEKERERELWIETETQTY